jgi:hypothetical protein
MGSGDRKRTLRPTKPFDSSPLAKQTRKPAGGTAPPATRAPRRASTPPISLPRTTTVEDPLTTQLLAEVTRRSATIDFDDAVIDEAVDKLGETQSADSAHPRTLRRKR